MKCTNCGAESVADEKFCSVCGSELAAEITAEGELETKDPGKALGLVGMILGIVGLVLSVICACTCYGAFPGFALSVAAIILGLIGKKKSAEAGLENKKANLGFILGIAGAAVCALAWIAWIAYYALVVVLGSMQ